MPADIPFVRDIEFEYGKADQVSPLIRRVVANNPGGFTYKGTGTYIVGQDEVAVIDPGPLDEAHIDALLGAIKGETVSHILITHTHMDHSPAAKPLKAHTGAPTYGFGPHGGAARNSDGPKLEEGADFDFVPDVVVGDGTVIDGKGWTIECVHTPGHTSNHICFGLREEKALFTGDHVMGWSTSIVSPPDGNMQAYMASLTKLLARSDEIYWPTHGPAITDPKPFVEAYLAHRRDREDQILAQIAKGRTRIKDMVPEMYANVDARLHPAAARSVLAHMELLAATGRIKCEGPPSLSSDYLPA